MISRRLVVGFGLALALVGLTFGATPVATQQPDSFYIVGLIKNPGQYRLEPNTTVGDAIDTAGGFMARGVSAIEIARIVNGEKEVVQVTFADIVRANDTIAVR